MQGDARRRLATVGDGRARRKMPRSVICFNLQKHKYFDRFIMLLIFLSSLKLATDTYMGGYSKESDVIKISNYTDSRHVGIFFGECIIKIIALGFTMDKGTYLRDSWN